MFFQKLILPEGAAFTLRVMQKGGQLTVMYSPEGIEGAGEVIVTGTPMELDEGLADQLKQSFIVVADALNTIKTFEESVKEAGFEQMTIV